MEAPLMPQCCSYYSLRVAAVFAYEALQKVKLSSNNKRREEGSKLAPQQHKKVTHEAR
jgi:hypothetical protein